MRTLKLVLLSFIFFLTSNLAHPLGVGDIKVNSALNEPLDAEIGLFALRPGEVGNVRVAMATPAEFARAGIDRPLVLSYLKFAIEEHADGSALIRVSSKKPVKEPFLDFLVEVNWASGRILREYTLLLDPPVFAQRKAAPVEAPAPAATPAPTEVTAAPIKKSPAPVATPASSGGDDRFPHIDIGGEAAPVTSQEAPASVTGGDYRTSRSDTLWSVAERLRPADVTTQQMMMALLAANPDAFTNNNINGLKSGQVLRIPDHDALLALSQHDALRAVREQHAAWQQVRGDLVSAPTSKGNTQAVTGSTGSVAGAEAQPEVKLVTPKAGETGAAADGSGKDLDALRQELALVNEQLASKSQENSDMRGRLQELQDQIQTMERLLALKNQSLEELQNKVNTAPQAPAVVAEPAKPAEPVVEPAQPTTPVPQPLMKDGKPYNPYAVTDIPKVETAPAKPATPAKPAKPAPVKQAPAEQGIVETVMGLLADPTLLAVIGGVVLLLLALIWIMARRRRVNAMGFPESILTERGASTTVTQNRDTEETSMLSDFTSTGLGSSLEEAGEVDPLAEADVYLAYNKYHQAEELLNGAIDNEPDRIDLKAKLLEVYASSRNADAFAELAETVHSKIDDNSAALWDKIVAMGKDLCPGNPLFGAATGESVLAINDLDDMTDSSESDLEFDLGDLSMDSDSAKMDNAAPAMATEEPEDELSLDMGELDTLEMGGSVTTTEPGDEFADLELDSLSLDTGSADDMAAPASDGATQDMADETAASGVDFGDIDLDALDAELMGSSTAAAEPGMDLDMPDDDSAQIGLDEVATKLDLAKAYIDMGDPDGARSILDEVLNEGNPGQKQEAQELLQQL